MTCPERPADDFHGIKLYVYACIHTCASPLCVVIPEAQRSPGVLLYLGTRDLSQHHAECVTLHQA